MKLVRFRDDGITKPGVIHKDKYLSLEPFIDDYNRHFFENGGIESIRKILDDQLDKLPIISQEVSLDCPVAYPSKLVCVGLNYAEHVGEARMKMPKEPVLFLKNISSIVGPNDNIVIPKGSKKTDWEVELALVIGKKASYISEDDAMDYVSGYMLLNDVSEREYQLERGGQWIKGKGCDTFAPIGPWFVTKDEIRDPHNLNLWLKVNGKIMQSSNTKHFIFNIPQLISYITKYMSLYPGDIISTGTPEGVGFGHTPQIFLKNGDIMELGIDGLGTAVQKVVNYTQN